MSKTLWNTIKIEVPNEMVNITKNNKVTVKKSLTTTNNISKANKEPSIKIIPGDVNKPKIISDGKEWNIEELKIRMKKAKDLTKKNEGKEYKKSNVSKTITSAVKDNYLRSNIGKVENYSRNQLEIIIKKIVGYKGNIDFFDRTNNNGASHTLDLKKFTDEDLKRQIKHFYKTYKPMTMNKTIPQSLLTPEILVAEVNPLKGLEYGSKKKKGRFKIKA